MKQMKLEERLREMRLRNQSRQQSTEHYRPQPVVSSSSGYFTVKEAAARLGKSVEWTRRYFRQIDGVLVMFSSPQAKKPSISIPVAVFEAEYRRFASRSPS